MTAYRRLATLPLPLLRTTRRLTSSRFSPSGKSLPPSSPLVLTTSRRLAPLPLLLIGLLALLALGGVLLWSAPAEAQSETTLVRNLSQGNDDSAALSGNDHAQLFHTAPNTGSNTGGWVVTSVIVDSEDTEGDDFDVDICLADDTTGFPTETCTDLKSRSDFTAGHLVFRAFFTGILLNANDNYTVVISQRGTGNVTLDSTTSGGEDSGSVAGWSIKGKFDWNNGGTWQQKSGANEALRIRIDGYERPGNRQPTGLPRVLSTGEDQGILYADTSRIADADGFVNIGDVESTGIHHEFNYQWIRVDGNTETNIADATSARYRRVEDDIGKHIKVEVSYTDRFGGAESVTSLPFGPVPAPAPSRPATTLVGNTGQTPASASSITSAYEMGFKLGTHGQGYEISSVSIDLTAAPSSLTVSLYAGGGPGLGTSGRTKLFDFENPDSFTVGLNEFTAPAGAFAYQNAQYFISLSGFGATLSINETTSDDEGAGGEPGATLADEAGGNTNVLRLAVKGSKRTSGIIASTYTQITGDQEIVSVGDEIGNEVFFGPEADRYLIRGLSFTMDDTTSRNGGFTNPWRMRSGSTTLFRMVSSRQVNGINEFTAPVGSTVAGRAGKYNLFVDIKNFDRMGEVVLTRYSCTTSVSLDVPSVPGVRFGEDLGDFACPTPIMAILGEPLYAMVQNLGQADNISVAANPTIPVWSQAFTTGPRKTQLTGIGVNIEGSDRLGVAQVPDGKPSAKLFDLISPSEFAPGHSFFEAPPGTTLAANTSYVLVWSYLGGAWHRLQATLVNNEDSGALAGFSIADAANWGNDIANQFVESNGNSLEIAVYTNQDINPPKRVTGFDLHSNNSNARGIWGNDDTFWVANDGSGATNKLYAYKRSDGSRDSGSDFDNLDTAGNDAPSGICSDGTTMFVADRVQLKIYAYKMSDTTRVTGQEFSLDSDNSSPQGLSCDPTHLWVADQTNSHTTSKIFVYEKDGTHASSTDIEAGTLSPSNNDGSINNHDQRGMWSNGATLFVVDHTDTQVYAYQLSDRSRDDDKNLDLDAANTDPWGLWFDGRVLWVVDDADDRLYVYDLPGAQPDNTPAEGAPEVRSATSEQVLTATLTAGTNPALGFGYITLLAPSVGSLSTTTFTRDSDTYTIKNLYDGNLGALVFILDKEMPVPFTLSVAGQDFRSISSEYAALGTNHTYSWMGANLSWSTNDTISVVLTVDAAPTDGVELRADVSGITDDTDGLDNVFYHYQWIRVDVTDVTELDGETGPTYTTTADDVTRDIQVRVIFDDDVRNREYPRYSRQVTVVEVPPVVTGVALTSDPNDDGRTGNDDTYAIGDSVTATVTFDKAVDVTAGPQITLLVGTADKAADCAAATNTTTMACSYEVEADDTAPDGVGIKANTLALNGGTIYSTGSTTTAATLTHSAQSLQSGHKVDGTRPALVLTGILSPRTSSDGTKVVLRFAEDIGGVIRANITLYDANDNTNIFSTASHSISGNTVELTLTTALTDSTTSLEMDLAVGAVTDAVGNFNAELNGSTVLNQLSAVPWAPVGFTAEPAPDETPQLAVDLSWTAPSSDGGSAITSHQYRYKVGSGSFGGWTTINDSSATGANATSFTVKGLPATATPPIVFVFKVRAINDNGNGADSPQRTATIDVPAITIATLTPGDGEIKTDWTTPANNGSAILRYRYFVRDDTTNNVITDWTNIPGSNASTTSYVVTGLTNGNTYIVFIRAVNSVGSGNTHTNLAVTPATHPTAPRSLRAEAGDSRVTLRWTAPLSNGGVAIDGYEYQQKTGNAAYGSWTDIIGAGATTTEHIVTGLTNGTSYRFKVRAKNPTGGEGPASNEVTAVPRTVPTAPQSLTATAGNGSVQLDWTAPSSDGGLPINRYQYRYRAGSGSFTTWANVPGSNVNTTTYTVTGLTNGMLHTLEVRAATASTFGVAASDTATPMAVVPGKPAVTVQSRDAALHVSWTLADDGGGLITEYRVQWKSEAESFDSSRQQAGLTAMNTLIENLINGTGYDVRVSAMNSIDWGPWSDIVSGTPVEGPAVLLSTETLSIDEGGSGAYSVVLAIEPTSAVAIPISVGGDVTTQPATLRFTTSNWETWQRVTVNAAQDGDADDDTVTIHHIVSIGSAAEYAALTDLPSVQVTVLDDDIPPPAVRGFIAADESQDAIALSWWSERGAGEYELEYREQGDTGDWSPVTRGDFDHLPSTSGNRSLTAIATGLECNTTYDFRIRLRGSGDILLDAFGPHAEVSHKTGQCAQPDRPTNLIYTLAPDCATLTWTAPTGGDYTGVRIRRLTLGDDNYTVIHESLNSRPTSHRDCTDTGDGYGDGDGPEYAYRVTYIRSGFPNIVESKPARSGLHQYGPAFQDHLHATPRNVRLTVDTDSRRRMTWEAPPSWSLTTRAGLQGASVPVRDPWITGYVVERREFMARADDYLYFTEQEDQQVWAATMTVEESSSGTRLGYAGTLGDAHGALTQDAFTHFSGNYPVIELTFGNGLLFLTLGRVPPAHSTEDWDLVIDGTVYSLADANIVESVLNVALISWAGQTLNWTNGQSVDIQLIHRNRYGWKTVRQGGNDDTSTSFTDNEQANGRKFVYRIRTTNALGVSTTHSIFDWLWDSPHRDAVVDLAATDTTGDGGAGGGSTNTPATGAPAIGGTPRVGETLTVSTSAIDDEDGMTNAVFSYQWTAGGSDISGATGSTHTLTSDQQGQTVQVRVSFTDDLGNEESLTSQATAAVSGLEISGISATDYTENGTSTVATYAATGAATSTTITWSLTGDDSDDFTISSSGALTFTSPPDYDTPSDSDTDNVYEVTVNASDGTNKGTLEVTVTVTDEAETQVGGL